MGISSLTDVFFAYVLPVIVIWTVAVQLRAIFASRDARLPAETTFAAREEYCGGIIDYIYIYTKPALRLSLYATDLVIKGYQHELALAYEDILSVEVTRQAVRSGVTIRHLRQEKATNVILFCDDNEATAAAIRARLGAPTTSKTN